MGKMIKVFDTRGVWQCMHYRHLVCITFIYTYIFVCVCMHEYVHTYMCAAVRVYSTYIC